MIEAVIFDYGGVISLPQRKDIIYGWAEKAVGMGEADLWKGYAAFRNGFDRGDYSGKEMYRRILTAAGKPFDDALLEELDRRDLDSWSFPNPETLAWARALKKEGLKVGILTNMPLSFIPRYNRAASEFRALADAEVISAAVRMAKPQPEIYREILSRLAVRPGDALFFDDLPANIAGARAVGLNAELFLSAAEARETLRRRRQAAE